MSNRTNLGPLTTVFTPPPNCASAIFDSLTGTSPWAYSLIWGMGCTTTTDGIYSVDWDTSCYPPDMYDHSLEAGAYQTIPIYSPGLSCPHGFYSACTVTRQPGDQVPATEHALWSVLSVGETAIGCCPL